MTFTVYAKHADDVCKRLDRLARKAARYSIPFSYTMSDTHPAPVTVYKVDPLTSTQYPVATYTVEAVDFMIECDALIKANGWTVRAHIEHGEQGNIVSAFGDKPADPAWYKMPAHCEHCNTNRERHYTFIVESESGELRQVGRACLHDYTGISPATALMWASVRDIFPASLDCSETEWTSRGPACMMPTTLVIGLAYDVIAHEGYRKSAMADSTRDKVVALINEGAEPTDEAKAKAEEINAWLVSLKGYEGMGYDIERDCVPLALSGFASRRHFGRLAYMPVAYASYLEAQARKAAREAEREAMKCSKHIGSVGERITVDIERAELITSWETMYGMTYLYKFVDADGNVFIWYASRWIEDVEGVKSLKGTVKDHNERDDVKQTIVTRCKVA